MNTTNQTADTIARVAPALVRDTRPAHHNLLRQVQQRNAEPVYHYSIIKNVGHVQLAISTSYIPVDDETVHQTLGDGRGHFLIASSVPHRRLARPVFDIVTRRSGQIKRRSGYRLWLAADGDSALLPDQPGPHVVVTSAVGADVNYETINRGGLDPGEAIVGELEKARLVLPHERRDRQARRFVRIDATREQPIKAGIPLEDRWQRVFGRDSQALAGAA